MRTPIFCLIFAALLGINAAESHANPIALIFDDEPVVMVSERVRVNFAGGEARVVGQFTYRYDRPDTAHATDDYKVLVPVIVPVGGIADPVIVSNGNAEKNAAPCAAPKRVTLTPPPGCTIAWHSVLFTGVSSEVRLTVRYSQKLVVNHFYYIPIIKGWGMYRPEASHRMTIDLKAANGSIALAHYCGGLSAEANQLTFDLRDGELVDLLVQNAKLTP